MNEQKQKIYNMYYPLLHSMVQEDIDVYLKNNDVIFFNQIKDDAFSKFQCIFPTLTPNQLISFNPMLDMSPNLDSHIVLYSGGFGRGLYCRLIFDLQNKQYKYQEGPCLAEHKCTKEQNLFSTQTKEPQYTWIDKYVSHEWDKIYRYVALKHCIFLRQRKILLETKTHAP